MKITPGEQFGDADSVFKNQVNVLTERITAELNKLEQLLLAGMVDRRVLTNFREAVNRIRLTSWSVQQSLEGGEAALPAMLLKERVRITEQLATQLSTDLLMPASQITEQELDSLNKAIQALLLALPTISAPKNEGNK